MYSHTIIDSLPGIPYYLDANFGKHDSLETRGIKMQVSAKK